MNVSPPQFDNVRRACMVSGCRREPPADKLVDVAFGAEKWLDHNDDARLALLSADYVALAAGK